MRVMIPSYKRAGRVKTVKALSGALREQATVCVHSEGEKEEYEKAGGLGGVPVVNLDVQVGMGAIREAMHAMASEGDRVLMMDDDIERFMALTKEGAIATMMPERFGLFVEQIFNNTERCGAHMWGIYPVANEYFMKPDYSIKALIDATVIGYVKTEVEWDPSMMLKSDYDFTLKHLIRDGRVLRANWIAAVAGHKTNRGGCKEYRREEMNAEMCKKLLGLYPELIRPHRSRAGELEITKHM
jgi:hypothetical protein